MGCFNNLLGKTPEKIVSLGDTRLLKCRLFFPTFVELDQIEVGFDILPRLAASFL